MIAATYVIKAINEHLEPAPETIEDRLTAAATDYVEKIKELEEEYLEEKYLEEKRLAFYEAAEEGQPARRRRQEGRDGGAVAGAECRG